MKLNKLIEKLDREAVLPEGKEERFNGYGVMGVTFCSGHVLALRHFPASSVGPGYTSVWHRNPMGIWDFYTDVEPQLSCLRYFGRAVANVEVTPIHIQWKGPSEFKVIADSPSLEWNLKLTKTASTAMLNLLSSFIPETAWKKEYVLDRISQVASDMLDTGKLTLSGIAPNGQKFKANPQRIWLINNSEACLAGEDLGPVSPLSLQAHIGEFCIPQKGLFVLGQVYFEPFNPEVHHLVTHIQAYKA